MRRFFPSAEGSSDLLPFDGKITGWLPAEGDDCALWHMEMGDGDDEELEEEEVRLAIAAFANGSTEPLPAGSVQAAKVSADVDGGVDLADSSTTESAEVGVKAEATAETDLVDSSTTQSAGVGAKAEASDDNMRPVAPGGFPPGKKRCSTPACELPEHHIGLCTGAVEVVGRRRSAGNDPPPPTAKLAKQHAPSQQSAMAVGAVGNGVHEDVAMEAAGEVVEEDVASLTTVELKGRLKDRGIKVGGKREELVERLQEAIRVGRSSAAVVPQAKAKAETGTNPKATATKDEAAPADSARAEFRGKRLWKTAEGRERWQAALRDVRSSAVLSVAIHALRVHCAAFGVLVGGATPKAMRLEAEFEVMSYYHNEAFVELTSRRPKRARDSLDLVSKSKKGRSK